MNPNCNREETIVAIATPPGVGALSVLRMTGPDSALIADRVFFPVGTARTNIVSVMPSHTCRVGRIIDPADGAVLDEVVLTRFIAPRSYTGEDMVEISCHGGAAVRRCILDVLLAAGARPAAPGEFTQRAFINGKMDLSQAEAVMDLIASTATPTVRAAASHLRGALSDRIRTYVDDLYGIIGRLEMSIEYPEHDDAEKAVTDIASDVQALTGNIQNFLGSYAQGRMLRDGLLVVIAGRPNVGKSSLLNRLTGYDRAIVTEIAGTTRDTVEETIEIKGLPVHLVDTAGLHETENQIEQKGIARTRSAISEADLVLWVSSPEEQGGIPPEQEVAGIEAAARTTRLAVIAGKGDVDGSRDHVIRLQEALENLDHAHTPPLLPFSAVTGEGLDAIRDQIVAVYEEAQASDGDDVLLMNARHAEAVRAAGEEVDRAAAALADARDGKPALTPDMVSLLLQAAAESLAEITGDRVTDRIVETVFSRFCVGK